MQLAAEVKKKDQSEQISQKEEFNRLLKKYDGLLNVKDAQRRGYDLQDLLNEAFELCGVKMRKPFTRNENGEQIDGALSFESWYYLVECR